MSIDQHAKAHGPRAIEILAEEMEDALESRDRIRAAEALLDRGYGKPSQAVIAIPASQRQRALLATYDDDSLIAIIDPPKAKPALPPPQGGVARAIRRSMNSHGPAADEAPAIDPLLL